MAEISKRDTSDEKIQTNEKPINDANPSVFRSDPSLNNSCEILSIREDSASVSNASSKGSEKANEKIAARFYPEALGSSSYIEKNGQISLTVIVQTINQVRTLCVGFGSSPPRPASHAFLKPLVLLGSFTNFSKG